jgi:hypothetical protein
MTDGIKIKPSWRSARSITTRRCSGICRRFGATTFNEGCLSPPDDTSTSLEVVTTASLTVTQCSLIHHKQQQHYPHNQLTSLLTKLLTPWSTVLLEKLTGLQLVKKLPTFYVRQQPAIIRKLLRSFWVTWNTNRLGGTADNVWLRGLCAGVSWFRLLCFPAGKHGLK